MHDHLYYSSMSLWDRARKLTWPVAHLGMARHDTQTLRDLPLAILAPLIIDYPYQIVVGWYYFKWSYASLWFGCLSSMWLWPWCGGCFPLVVQMSCSPHQQDSFDQQHSGDTFSWWKALCSSIVCSLPRSIW